MEKFLDQYGTNHFVLFPDDFSAFLVDQVMDQHLRVRVAWIGPNLNHQFLCTFRNPKPLMFFDWWPNQLSNLEEFMPVSFPPCSSYKGMNSSYLCNYELHSLKKMIWSNLPETAKVAVEVRHNGSNEPTSIQQDGN